MFLVSHGVIGSNTADCMLYSTRLKVYVAYIYEKRGKICVDEETGKCM